MIRSVVPSLLAAAAMTVLASCSTNNAPSLVPTTGSGQAAEEVGDVEAESTTTVTFTPLSASVVDTPFSIPPLDTDEIDVMIDEALEDDVVDADEIAAVLERAGLDPEVARCEADLLVELGVEDVGGGLELQRAADALTPEQLERLEQCLGS